MRRCVICGHGLREFICIEPNPDSEPYYWVDICMECVEKIKKWRC